MFLGYSSVSEHGQALVPAFLGFPSIIIHKALGEAGPLRCLFLTQEHLGGHDREPGAPVPRNLLKHFPLFSLHSGPASVEALQDDGTRGDARVIPSLGPPWRKLTAALYRLHSANYWGFDCLRGLQAARNKQRKSRFLSHVLSVHAEQDLTGLEVTYCASLRTAAYDAGSGRCSPR